MSILEALTSVELAKGELEAALKAPLDSRTHWQIYDAMAALDQVIIRLSAQVREAA